MTAQPEQPRTWWGVEHNCNGVERVYPTLHWADEPETGAGPRQAFECDACGDRYAFHEAQAAAPEQDEAVRLALIGLLNALNVYERNWLTSSTGYGKVAEAKEHARATLAIEAQAAAPEQDARATTRMTLAQALLGSDLIARLLEYAGTNDDPRQLAQSWANRIADWIDQHDGWEAAAPEQDEAVRLLREWVRMETTRGIGDEQIHPDSPMADLIRRSQVALASPPPVPAALDADLMERIVRNGVPPDAMMDSTPAGQNLRRWWLEQWAPVLQEVRARLSHQSEDA